MSEFAIVDIQQMIEVCRVRTPEEAHHMLYQWQQLDPAVQFEIMRVA